MCVSKGAPRKPAYGPCNEQHGIGDIAVAMAFMVTLAPVITMLEDVLKKIEEVKVCV